MLKKCLDSGFVPSWSTKGRTALLQKDKSESNVASNYRPLSCLPLMWKLLFCVIEDHIYGYSYLTEVVTRRTEGMQEKI